MARHPGHPSWKPLRTIDDRPANDTGVIVVHQLYLARPDEAPTKYHYRDCRSAQLDDFARGAATGTNNAQWFWAPDTAAAAAGGAVLCGGQCSGR